MGTRMKKINIRNVIKNYGIALVLVVIVIILTILRPNFINPANLIEIMRQVSFTGIVAVGMTFCLLTGGIDLSVGSNVGLAVVVCALIMSGRPVPLEATGGVNINPILGIVVGILARCNFSLLF